MFDPEDTTSYSTFPLEVRHDHDRFAASSPELFASNLDKFEENEDPALVSTTLEVDVAEDYTDPEVEAQVDEEDDEEEESDASDVEEEEEEDADELVTPDLPVQNVTTPRVDTKEVSKAQSQVPAVDPPQPQMSILGGRYLLVSQPQSSSTSPTSCSASSGSQPISTAGKNVLKCIHFETREQFLCKVVPRNATGLNLLAAYHQLSDFANSVMSIHEIILSPKSFYLIFPPNYGNVHAYVLAKKRLPEDEAAHLCQQMVTAVKHCHSKGIVLRDLKLGKFVFTDKERTTIKLESLEDAVVLPADGDDGLSDKHGCPNYVSPEKAEILRTNSKYPGKATDIWGLGVMLYTMLVGRYPFNDPDHGKLFLKIRKGLFSIPECLSQNVKCVIRCLLRKEPTSRLSCDEILRHPWIIQQGTQTYTGLPRSNHSWFTAMTQESSTRRRAFDTTEATNDDQVVPVWTPPAKKSRPDQLDTSTQRY